MCKGLSHSLVQALELWTYIVDGISSSQKAKTPAILFIGTGDGDVKLAETSGLMYVCQ